MLLLASLILIVSGCTSTSEPLPDWAAARVEMGEVKDATPLPGLCEISWDDSRCDAALAIYEQVSIFNEAAANGNASVARKAIGAYGLAIDGGEKQQWISEQYRIALEEEKLDHFWDNMKHYALIVLGMLGAIFL